MKVTNIAFVLSLLMLFPLDAFSKWELKNHKFINDKYSIQVPVVPLGGDIKFIEEKKEKDNLHSITFSVGEVGTKYQVKIIKKALIDYKKHRYLGQAVYKYINVNTPKNLMPSEPKWDWNDEEIVVTDDNFPTVKINIKESSAQSEK